VVIDLFTATAEQNRAFDRRTGAVVDLPDHGQIVITGDLHDHRVNFQKALRYANLAKMAGNHLLLQELIHGERLINGMDLSYRTAAEAAALQRDYPGRVHVLLSNHELAQINGEDIAKHGISSLDAFHAGLEYVFGDEANAVHDAYAEWVRSLPLALERDDLRVVHACWDDDGAEALRHERGDVLDLFNANERRIIEQLDRDGIADEVDRNLARQNGCAVKVLTSGKEKRAETPFHAGERLRHEARVPWWIDYDGDAFIVFGHYSRTKPELQNGGGLPLFPADPFTAVGNTMCIDLGVGGGAAQRRNGGLDGTLHLAALRWPEQQVVRDTGDRVLPH